MAEYKRMQQRNDTSANWATVNPVLADGEIGYDTTQKKFKMGDGTSTWSQLDYYESGGGGAMTPGKGINISNDEISVNVRPTQFSFSGTEMYLITTGDGGFVTKRVLDEAINGSLGVVYNELITI